MKPAFLPAGLALLTILLFQAGPSLPSIEAQTPSNCVVPGASGGVRGASITPPNTGGAGILPSPAREPFTQTAQDCTGPAGARGAQGNPGPMGPTSPQGPAGADGTDGTDGLDGATGATGPTGPTGPTGATGPQGEEGPEGPTGDTGPEGPEGPEGPVGPAGVSGYVRIQGTSDLSAEAKSAVATCDPGLEPTGGGYFLFTGIGASSLGQANLPRVFVTMNAPVGTEWRVTTEHFPPGPLPAYGIEDPDEYQISAYVICADMEP